MSTVHFRHTASLSRVAPCLALGLALVLPGAALGQDVITAYKDELFAARGVLETRDNGDYEKIDYSVERDIHQRDEIAELHVKSAWVDLAPRPTEVNETVTLGGHKLDIFHAGTGKAFSVIFIHGRDGSRDLGASDFRFGGNFNRLKNIALRNNGYYVAPTIKTFDSDGVARVKALVLAVKARAPEGKVVLSCASMGSFLCWGIARDPQAVAALSGMLVMGGAHDPSFATSAFVKAKKPIWFTHGSEDPVYSWMDQHAVYVRLHAKGYPARFTLFNTGGHGMPIRMTDWRRVLNWMLAKPA